MLLTVSGTGFAAGSEVRIFYDASGPDPSKLEATTTTAPDGTIEASFTVPSGFGEDSLFACQWSTTNDTCVVVVNGSDGQATATFVHQGSPSVRLEPGQGEAGITTQLSGGPFAPQTTCGPVRILFDGTQVATATPGDSDGDGDLEVTVTFPVPARPVGGYTVSALQTDNGCEVSDDTLFEVIEFTVTPSSGPVGSSFTASGAGFESDVLECGSVAIRFDGELLTSVAPREDGTFDVVLTVPGRPLATYVVEANQGSTCGRGGDIRATDPFSVTSQSLDLLPAEGPAGASTRGIGSGFTPDLPLVLEFDGDVVVDEPAGSSLFISGTSFEAPFTVPDRSPGSYLVLACQPSCDDPDRLARATFVVRLGPGLVLDPPEGPIETTVVATGADFADGVDVDLRFGEEGPTVATVPGSEVTGGGFETEFTVPADVAGGVHDVIACQDCGTPNEVRASAVFTVTPRLVLEPAIGPPGFVTRATGDGFAADTGVLLEWRPGIGQVTVTTNEVGAFVVQVLVFHKDILGPRELQAVLAEPPEVEEAGPLATAEFVVSPGTQQPRDFSSRR